MQIVIRKIRLFFSHYGSFLFKCIFGVFVLMFVLYNINLNVKKETEEKKEYIQEANLQKQKANESKEISLEFVTYCSTKEIEKAYNMLSTKSKEQYSSLETFKNNFYDIYFNQKIDYKIESYKEDVFKVILLEDILESGKIENRKQKEFLIKGEKDLANNEKVSINIKE